MYHATSQAPQMELQIHGLYRYGDQAANLGPLLLTWINFNPSMDK